MRSIYLGTPEFAVPTLEKLLDWPHCQVVAVVTQPDRPAGRGKHLFAPPTKLVAQAHNIPVFQPERLSRSPETVQAMAELQPDILITVAFGQILKQDVLSMAPFGVLNLHGSLLPAYRGAAPINWAIINGEKITGNTTMFSEAGIDTGPMLLKQEVPIGPDTNAEELAEIMSRTGAGLVIETLEQLRTNSITAVAQDHSLATSAPRLTRELGLLDWNRPAQQIHNLVRGLYPWPGTYTVTNGAPLKIIRTSLGAEINDEANVAPGTVILQNNKVLVRCGDNTAIELLEVQPPNKSRMAARDWANGAHIKTGIAFGV